MKLLISVFIVVLLSACVPEYEATINNVVYVGDSNCELFDGLQSSAAMYASVIEDCKIGRTIMEVESLPDVDLVFLALGANDNVDAETYGNKIDDLIGSTAGYVVCVLPVSDSSRYDHYREEMASRCIETIDPFDAAVIIADDGVHYTDKSSQWLLHFLLVDKINELLG